MSPVLEDTARLEALRDSALLDVPDDEAFDRFTKLAAQLLGCPVSLVSLIDKERQFFKSAHGLPPELASVRETPLSHSVCQHVVATGQPLMIMDARDHPLLRGNGAISEFGVVAYLGAPLITREGHALGSLCVIDMKPREWSEASIEILQDLAAMVMTEIDLRITGRKLRTTNLALQMTEVQRDELVHMIVHDLRNPLSSMLLALEMVDEVSLRKDQSDLLKIARISGDRLLGMVGEILEANKAEVGPLRLNRTPVSPSEMLLIAQEQVARSAEAAGVNLKACIAPGVGTVLMDGGKMQRVLVNLLANAIQHSPGESTVTTSVEISDRGDALVFTVEDRGEGIPAALLPVIFDKYNPAAGRKNGAPSSGLGLASCKKIVDAHGGEICVSSEVGEGSVFRVTIPRAPAY
ncbi:MAG TPA: GAF domain-containing sensor histidine kinase [Chthoniobacteraceae bacterium]